MSPNPPTSHPLMKMGFRQRWQAKFILSPYPIQAAGFTLIELSIVLVIIGLIAGGVLVGKDLLHQAKLRRINAQLQEYETAAMTFRLKYNQIPGDMTNATMFFGTYCQKAGFPNVGCNGNGDLHIGAQNFGPGYLYGQGWKFGNLNYIPNNTTENVMIWRHLFLAGLIKEDLTGQNTSPLAGVNTPKTELNLGIAAQSRGFFVGNFSRSPASPALPYAGGSADQSSWIARDIWQFDLKFDDGKPTTGKYKLSGTYYFRDPTYCTQDGTLGPNSTYRLSGTHSGTRLCSMVYQWLK